MKRALGFVSLVLIAISLAGCFTTSLNLGSAEDAKTDPAYDGDWHFTVDNNKPADLIIRTFNAKQYYVEWKEGDEKPVRMSGFIIPIKDTVFVQLSPLDSKSDDKEKNLILRVELKGDKLTLRHLKKDFFSEVTTDAQLRERVEKNLDNAEMYDETSTGSRVPQP